MKLYLDTGLFIDYLVSRGHSGTGLRSAARRGRALAAICSDAELLLQRVATSTKHQSATSVLSYYEVEEALYKQLATDAKGVAQAAALVLPVARPIVIQMQMVIRLFRIDVVDLTASTVQAQLLQQELYLRSIRAADSLHVMTAISVGADILVSGDDAILQLDGVLKNISGNTLRCLDSDGALRLI